jgi:hypothetical protein
MGEFLNQKENQWYEGVAPVARISGLQSSFLPFTDFEKWDATIPELDRKYLGAGIAS